MTSNAPSTETGRRVALAAFAWAWVTVPFAYGVWQLLIKVVQLFSG